MIQQLFIHWHADPVLIHFGSIGIRMYSLLFLGGFILGWYLMKSFFRREKINEDLLESLFNTMLFGTIIGARLGHCLFYQPDYYLGSLDGFLEIFMPWKGGLASHGGAVMLFICIWAYARKYGKQNNFDFLWLLDRLCITVAFAGCMIRLGNLFNSEIYGDVTSLPWGFIFDLRHETQPKHPTQLYESLSYLILGLGLLWLYRHKAEKLYRGTLVGLFLTGCFGMRFIIEFIKEPQEAFEEGMVLNMGQILSIPLILTGTALLIYAFVRKKSALVEK